MRLIDADALIDEINSRINAAIEWGTGAAINGDDEIKTRAEQAVATFCEASLTVKKMPTIEERKTGEWSEAERKKSEVFFCSLCGGRAYHPWVGSRKDERKNECGYGFCPNCGARMET